MFMYLKVQRGEAILEKDSLLFSFIPISSNADALLVTQNHLVDWTHTSPLIQFELY